MENIATVASRLPKINKNKAISIIKELAETHPENLYELAKLYNFFIPSAPSKPKTAYHWVAKATGNDKLNKCFRFVYCDEENLVATDGHRMHVAKNAGGLPAGFYHPKTGDMVYGIKDRDAPSFPNYKRVIPDFLICPYTVESKDVTELQDGTLAYMLRTTINDTVCCVDKNYYDQAVSFGAKETLFRSGKEIVIVKVSDDAFALIMPVSR